MTPQNSGVSPSSGHSDLDETSKHASQLGLLPMGLMSLGVGPLTRALPCPSLHLRDAALRVEIADMAALRPRCWIDRAIDQGRLPRSQRIGESLREPQRIDGIVADAAEGFDQLFVARVLHQAGRRGVGATAAVAI